jgi:hypothetical protein
MDDQIAATAQQNGKLTMIDYYQLPLFKGANGRASTNISYEPGSFLPDGVEAVQMPTVPAQFDFDIDSHKRAAARRSGSVGMYEFSDQLAVSRKVQKTATEIQSENQRGTMVSSASVDRFNAPWCEVYMQLWEDLKRLKIPLPLLGEQNFAGTMDLSIYEMPFLIVPASSAKTMNPDAQFGRDTAAFSFLAEQLLPLGVTINAEAAASDILANWDAFKAKRWLLPPNVPGPHGEQPVYKTLAELTQQIQMIAQAVKAIGEAHLGTTEKPLASPSLAAGGGQ